MAWTVTDSLLNRIVFAALIDHGLSPGDILRLEQRALLVEIDRLEAIQKTRDRWQLWLDTGVSTGVAGTVQTGER